MTDTATVGLRKTPLNARHRASHGRMVAFAGWDMPVEYTGIVPEHMAVRTRAGVFDISHMGESRSRARTRSRPFSASRATKRAVSASARRSTAGC